MSRSRYLQVAEHRPLVGRHVELVDHAGLAALVVHGGGAADDDEAVPVCDHAVPGQRLLHLGSWGPGAGVGVVHLHAAHAGPRVPGEGQAAGHVQLAEQTHARSLHVRCTM